MSKYVYLCKLEGILHYVVRNLIARRFADSIIQLTMKERCREY